jgi:hypothetical protein
MSAGSSARPRAFSAFDLADDGDGPFSCFVAVLLVLVSDKREGQWLAITAGDGPLARRSPLVAVNMPAVLAMTVE